MQDNHTKFSVRNRLKSFGYALCGIKKFLLTEHNTRVHLLAAIVVVFLGVFYHISNNEWLAVCIVIGLVLAMEMLNTAVEEICNFISPQKHPQIKYIKDVAAGAVLVSAVAALIVGLIVFIPKIF